MKKKCFFILLWAVLFIVPLIIPSNLHASKDPRFFGTYCGEGSFTVTFTIEVRGRFTGHVYSRRTETRTYSISNIKVHLEYKESSQNGIVYGRGSGFYEGRKIPFVIAGNVISRGRIRGYLKIRGVEPYRGEARLSDDGLTLTVNVFGGRATATLGKDRCGNRPPNVTIDLPETGGPFTYGDIIHFRAVVRDEDPISSFPDRRLIWESRPVGASIPTVLRMGYGDYIRTTDLPPGRHDIYFTAIDSGGLKGSDTIRIDVTNHSPNAPEILSPGSGDSFPDCQKILFHGQASDREDGFLPGSSLTWESSIDGPLGSGRIVCERLSLGDHIITLTATDNARAKTSTSITVHVTASSGNCPPVPEIRLPGNLYVFIQNTPITFIGRAHDAEDGWIRTEGLQWYYKLGESEERIHLGTGANITADAPSVDRDTAVTIILEATDDDGETAEFRIIIYVIWTFI